MKLLVLGGGVFLGASLLRAAIGRGHRLTVFNRGRACSTWPAAVEVLCGDRFGELDALRGRRWDAVVDTSGYLPQQLRASTAALRDSGRYLFVSSVSAYASFERAPVLETDPLADNAGLADDDRSPEHYGAQKAACEIEVQRVFGARALIIRPGLIVGPGDPTGRFSHWPWRMAEGGEMLVPDIAAGLPLQFIDVRDLAEWMVFLLEQGCSGAFNATGACDAPAHDWPRLLAACADEASRIGATPATAVPVSEAFLAEQDVKPWTELPLWLPANDSAHAAFMQVSVDRARAHGLRTRALRETVAAVLQQGVPDIGDARRKGKLAGDREPRLLALWRGESA